MATTDRQKYWNPAQVQGAEGEESIPIDAITDGSGKRRLAVDATITSGFVVSTESSELNDEIAVYGGVDGSETADAATRQIVNVDTSGRVRVVGAAADGAAVAGNPVRVAGKDGSGNTQDLLVSTTGAIAAAQASTAQVQVDAVSNTWQVPIDETGQTVNQGVIPYMYNGTTWDRVRGTAADGLTVNLGANNDVTNPALSVVGGGTEATAQRVTIANDSTGVLSVDDNGGALTVDQATAANLNAQIVGTLAHDAADTAANQPVKVGARAVAHGTNPAAVAAGDVSHFLSNRAGVQWTIGGHPNVQTSQYVVTDAGGAVTDDNLLPAIAGGTKYAVTRVTVTVDEATTVGVAIRLGFGAATIPAVPTPPADAVAGILLTHPGLVPGGGITVGDGSGVLGVGGDGEELRVTCEDPVGGAVHFTVSWFSIES